jgi:site-specific DNA-adenine methylase
MKQMLIKNFLKTVIPINTVFTCYDFRDVLNKISYRNNQKESDFIYADPPYVCTRQRYNENVYPNFKINDFKDLVKILIDSGIKFAISHCYTDEIIEVVKQNKLHWIKIKEIRAIKNKITEILITNYKTEQEQIEMEL